MNPIEKTIIDQANLLCTNAFMDFPDYDPENPFTNLADALTVIIWDSLQLDCDSAVIYDFLNERLKEPETQETEKKTPLDEAMDKVTIELINSLEYGEEIKLNEKYTLYHYTEEDIIVLNETEEWEEIFQIMTEGEKIIFEKL